MRLEHVAIIKLQQNLNLLSNCIPTAAEYEFLSKDDTPVVSLKRLTKLSVTKAYKACRR